VASLSLSKGPMGSDPVIENVRNVRNVLRANLWPHESS
jgi:hypothetical protein